MTLHKFNLYWKPLLSILLIFLALLSCGYFMHEWMASHQFPQGKTVLLILAASFISCSATLLLSIGTGKATRQQIETQTALLEVQATMKTIAEDQKNVSQTNMAAPHFRNYLDAAALFVMECFEAYRTIKNADNPDSKFLIHLMTQKSHFKTSAKIIEGLFSHEGSPYPEISSKICTAMDQLINEFGETLLPGKLQPERKDSTVHSLFQVMKLQTGIIEENLEVFSSEMGNWLGRNFSQGSF